MRYLSCIKHVEGVIGNSSSGLLKVPSFKKGTINIGDRQKDRLKSPSVIDWAPERKAISDSNNYLFSPSFQEKLKHVDTPYGNGGASEAIVKVLVSAIPNGLLKNPFTNIQPRE